MFLFLVFHLYQTKPKLFIIIELNKVLNLPSSAIVIKLSKSLIPLNLFIFFQSNRLLLSLNLSIANNDNKWHRHSSQKRRKFNCITNNNNTHHRYQELISQDSISVNLLLVNKQC